MGGGGIRGGRNLISAAPGAPRTRKTTIRFSPRMHRRLTELAARQGRSLGELVREACEVQYGVVGGRDQEAAVAELAALALPVDTPEVMKQESVPDPDDLLP